MTNEPLPKSTDPWWRTGPRTLLRQVIGLDDTAHNVALGAAVGMFVGWTPTVGIQMVIVVIVAFLMRPFFRFNQFAALVGVYVSNPVTMLPMYWLMYWVGTFFVSGNATYEQFAAIAEAGSMSELWDTLTRLFVDIGFPLIVGSLILATIFALLTYPAMRYLLARRTTPADARCPSCDAVLPLEGVCATCGPPSRGSGVAESSLVES